jgi:hypothetical protein
MEFEQKVQDNIRFIVKRWINFKMAGELIAKKIPGIQFECICTSYFQYSSGRLEDNFYLAVFYPHSNVRFTVSFKPASDDMLKIVPFVYSANVKAQLRNDNGRVIMLYVSPHDVDKMNLIFNSYWGEHNRCIRGNLFYSSNKEKFISKRFDAIRTVFTQIAMMIPGVILYNTFPYVLCLPSGEFTDNFYFDARHADEAIQFTVSFEARSWKNLKIVPFVLYKGLKMQMRNSEGFVIKRFVPANDFAAIKLVFDYYWTPIH